MKYSSLSTNYSSVFSFPFYACSISAGFPSPADDYIQRYINLNEELVFHPASTFFIKVPYFLIQENLIFEGDILILDRSIKPRKSDLVFFIKLGSYLLQPYYKFQPTSILGVVTTIIHCLRKAY